MDGWECIGLGMSIMGGIYQIGILWNGNGWGVSEINRQTNGSGIRVREIGDR